MDRLFSYINYRAFLGEYYKEKKATTRYFSYRWFAEKAGINSPAFLREVIEGRRNLTAATTEKFIKALELSGKESEYFRVLVSFNQAKTASEKQKNYALMISMADFIKDHQIETDSYFFFKQWYIPVVRELITLQDFQDDWKRLASAVAPTISLTEARSAVEQLLRMGFIQKESDGSYIQKDAAVTSGVEMEEIMALACRSFNQEMLRHGATALDRYPVDERFAMGITVGISPECYEMLTQEMTAFRERIISIVDRDKTSDQVYHINMNIFPVSTTPPKPKNEEE